MGTVTIHNYHFPIHFSYKGWNVEITDKTGIFSMKDLKVRVKIEVAAGSLASDVSRNYALIRQMIAIEDNKNRQWYEPYLTEDDKQKIFQDSYHKAYQHYIKIANDFARNKGKHDFTIGVNGGMMDRFFGQNISATEKACKQVIEYIDKNLGDANKEFSKYVDYKKEL